jgi:hypothetical protein
MYLCKVAYIYYHLPRDRKPCGAWKGVDVTEVLRSKRKLGPVLFQDEDLAIDVQVIIVKRTVLPIEKVSVGMFPSLAKAVCLKQ